MLSKGGRARTAPLWLKATIATMGLKGLYTKVGRRHTETASLLGKAVCPKCVKETEGSGCTRGSTA